MLYTQSTAITTRQTPYICAIHTGRYSSAAPDTFGEPLAGLCDFTIGGIYLWKDYFMYSLQIVDGTLFIKGVAEDNLEVPAFSLPVGAMPLAESLGLLREHCTSNGIRPLLSAVPADRLDEIRSSINVAEVSELPDWADYLYEIEPMATFKGKKMSKKRNHVNRFYSDHPDAIFEPLTTGNILMRYHFCAITRHHRPTSRSQPTTISWRRPTLSIISTTIILRVP